MKNLLRAFALSLVATGAFASANSAAGSALHSKVSVMPVPSCAPGNGQTCGICKVGSCPAGS